MDLVCGQSFVAAVVDLPQQVCDLGFRKTRELGCAQGALQRARVDGVEGCRLESGGKRPGLIFAMRCEGQVCDAGVPP